MKNIRGKNFDPMAEARKHPLFAEFSEKAGIRIRFSIEMYNMRAQKDLSQQALAKLARTTQKVISNIENGDINIGLDSMNRIGRSLGFGAENWGRIFNFVPEIQHILVTDAGSVSSNELIGSLGNNLNYNISAK